MARRLLPIAVFAAILSPVAGTASAASLKTNLKRAMAGAGSSSGAFVMDAASGRTIFSRRGTTPRILASNTKLFTSAAVLGRYGRSSSLATTLIGSGSLQPNGRWKGDLHLRGGGRPPLRQRLVRARHLRLERERRGTGRPARPGRLHVGHGRGGGRRVVLRLAARRPVLGLRHVGLRRADQRAQLRPRARQLERQRVPEQPAAVRGHAARSGTQRARDLRQGEAPHRRRTVRRGVARRGALPERRAPADAPEQGLRQLLRRDAPEGAAYGAVVGRVTAPKWSDVPAHSHARRSGRGCREGAVDDGHDQGGNARRDPLRELARRDGAPRRRLGALALGPRRAEADRSPPAGAAAPGGLLVVLRVAAGRGARRHARRPDAERTGARPLPRQDGYAERRECPVRILRQSLRAHAHLLR